MRVPRQSVARRRLIAPASVLVLVAVLFAVALACVPGIALAEDSSVDAGFTAEEIDGLLSAHGYVEGRALAEVTEGFEWPEAALAAEGGAASVQSSSSVQSLYEFGGASLASESEDVDADASAPARVVLIQSDSLTTRQILEQLADMDGVLAAQPDYVIQTGDGEDATGADATATATLTTATATTTNNAAAANAVAATTNNAATAATSLRDTLSLASSSPTNDPYSYLQYWLYDYNAESNPTGTNVQALWSALGYTSSASVPADQERVVAVVDSGVDLTNPDLQGILWSGGEQVAADGNEHGYNCYAKATGEDPSYIYPSSGHGTHVAGLIAAEMGNQKGVSGMAPNARIMVLQTTGQVGATVSSAVICAYDYIAGACEAGIEVTAINDSWGAFALEDPFMEVVSDACKQTGAVSFIASGNSGIDLESSVNSPTLSPSKGIVVVDALAEDGGLRGSSNYGSMTTDIAAAGQNMLSTWNSYSRISTDSATVVAENDYSSKGGELLPSVASDEGYLQRPLSYDVEEGAYVWDVSCTSDEVDYGAQLAVQTAPIDLSGEADKGGLAAELDAYVATDPAQSGAYSLYVSVKLKDGSWAAVSSSGGLYPQDSKTALSVMLAQDASGNDIRDEVDWESFQLRFWRYATSGLAKAKTEFHLCAIKVYSGAEALPYKYGSGTSMATPVVTGAYALLSALYPSEDAEQLICRLLGAVRHDEVLEGTSTTNGALDLSRALDDGDEQPVVRSVEQDEADPTKVTVTGRFFGGEPGTVVLAQGIAALGEEGLAGVEVTSWSDTRIELALPAGQDAALLYVTVRRAGETSGSAYGSLRVALDATPGASAATVSEALPTPDFEALGVELFSSSVYPWQVAEADGVIYALNTRYATPEASATTVGHLVVLAYDPEAASWEVAAQISDELAADFGVVLGSDGTTLYIFDTWVQYDEESVRIGGNLYCLTKSEDGGYALTTSSIAIPDLPDGSEPYCDYSMARMSAMGDELVMSGISCADSADSLDYMLVIGPRSGEASWEPYEPGLVWSAAAVADGSLYVVGGLETYETSDPAGIEFETGAWRWDGESWEAIASLPEDAWTDQLPAAAAATLPAGATVRLADGSDFTLARESMLVVGVAVGSGGEPDCYVYDAEAGEWRPLAERVLLTHVAGAGAATLGDGVYVLGYDISGSSSGLDGSSNLVFRRLAFKTAADDEPDVPVGPVDPSDDNGSGGSTDDASAATHQSASKLPATGDATAPAGALLVAGAVVFAVGAICRAGRTCFAVSYRRYAAVRCAAGARRRHRLRRRTHVERSRTYRCHPDA